MPARGPPGGRGPRSRGASGAPHVLRRFPGRRWRAARSTRAGRRPDGRSLLAVPLPATPDRPRRRAPTPPPCPPVIALIVHGPSGWRIPGRAWARAVRVTRVRRVTCSVAVMRSPAAEAYHHATARSGKGAGVYERLSLLLPVWQRDRPEHLTAAFRSTVLDQTRRPDHVVIVRDGPVAPALAQTLAELAATSPVPVDVLELDRNVGLGPALDAGLRGRAGTTSWPGWTPTTSACRSASRSRCRSSRRARTSSAPGCSSSARAPTTSSAAASRRPTPTTSAPGPPVRRPLQPPDRRLPAHVRAGGRWLRRFRPMEDYLLWAKMILAGARVANVAEPLVALPGRCRRVPASGRVGAAAHRAGSAAPSAGAGLHHAGAVRAQRRRARRVPARPGGRAARGLPPARRALRRARLPIGGARRQRSRSTCTRLPVPNQSPATAGAPT